MRDKEKRDAQGDKMHEFKSGARRSEVIPRYDLIPRAGLRRIAERYTIGAAKYGEWNWQKGLTDPEFVQQLKNHMIDHLYLFLRDGCVDDDHLAAVSWGAIALMTREDLYGIECNRPNQSLYRDRTGKIKARKVPR